MKAYRLTIVFSMLSLLCYGQQDALFSQYVFNPFIVNPSYAGFGKEFAAAVAYRNQWSGFEGSPTTMNVAAHTSLFDNRMGAGVLITQDKIGVQKTTEVNFAYGYHVPLKETTRLSFGLQGGFQNFSTDYSELNANPDDPKLQGRVSEIFPTIGAGVTYSTERLFASFSVPKILNFSTNIDGNNILLYNRHYYFYSTYIVNLSPRLKTKPFTMLRYVQGGKINADVGAQIYADDSYAIGFFTRSMHTYGALIRLNIGETLRLGYIFEVPTNRSVGIRYNAHELQLSIRAKAFRFHDIQEIRDF